MTWVHVALAVLVTIIVLVIAVSRSYALGRESGERDTLAGQGSDSGSLFGTDVPVREAEQGLIDVMPSEVIVCDGNGSVRCSSKSQVNVDVIENGWIVKDEILDILHVVVENGGVREREMCVSLDLTRMSSAISGRGVTAGSSAPSDSYLRVRVGHICDGLYAVFINDVTEQRRFERMRRDFVTNVSHELKTPVTILKGQLSGMLDGVGVYRDREKYLARSLQVAGRMEALVGELLAVSRMESDGASRREAVELSALTAEKLAQDAELLEQRGMTAVEALEPGLLVEGERALLGRAVENLLSNAALYSPEGAEIRVTAAARGAWAVLTVENTGARIPAEALPHLFEAFYRAEPSRSRATGGSGLGLYLVRMIVERHGGTCRIENSADGVRFTALLPRLSTENT